MDYTCKMLYMYRLFSVLCWLWNIYEGAELPSVYFITNTKHCIPYLALTQLFPVLLTHRLHIVKYTYYVVFCCISFIGVCRFVFSHGRVQMEQMDFISSIFFNFCKMIWEIFHWSHITDVYADQSPLFVLSDLIHKQWILAHISLYIHVPFDHNVFIK